MGNFKEKLAASKLTPNWYLDRLADDHQLADTLVATQDLPAQTAVKIAQARTTSSETLDKLATHPDENVRLHVIWSGWASEETLLRLVTDPEEQVRFNAIRHVDADTLEQLATDERLSVRRSVADATDDIATLFILATDEDPEIRQMIARNHLENESGVTLKKLADILDMLAVDKDVNVREEVAKNYYTRKDTLTLLASDASSKVREGVAENYRTPMDVLSVQLKDPDVNVALAAEKTHRQNQQNKHPSIQKSLTNPDSARELYDQMKKDGKVTENMLRIFLRYKTPFSGKELASMKKQYGSGVEKMLVNYQDPQQAPVNTGRVIKRRQLNRVEQKLVRDVSYV